MRASPASRIEVLSEVGSFLFVLGWCEAEGWSASLRTRGRALTLLCDFHVRPDVAAHRSLPVDGRFGFAVIAKVEGERPQAVQIETDRGVLEIPLKGTPFTRIDRVVVQRRGAGLPNAIASVLATLSPDHPEFPTLSQLVPDRDAACAGARGNVDTALQLLPTGEIVVSGWCSALEDALVWFETDTGTTVPLSGANAYRFDRQDVAGSLDTPVLPHERVGFIARLGPGPRAARISLRALFDGSVHLLGARALDFANASDARGVARHLFAIDTPIGEFAQRCRAVDGPFLDVAIGRRRGRTTDMRVREAAFGNGPASPLASIVVPLYGVHAFAEHQLQAFARDPDLRRDAEILYVVDDPAIASAAEADIGYWSDLYGVGCRVVLPGVNLGFSGANNLGATRARGDALIFLNSDVFPVEPGWLGTLLAQLAPAGPFAIAGPRLLSPDGAIQHDGMVERVHPDLGIRYNDHPRLGLDPAAVGAGPPRPVEAVTGACLAIPRPVLESVGGWSEAYLVGDFEDSDLCAAVRAAGQEVGLVPEVTLVHLERQSMALIGESGFRQRLTILNAVRHEERRARVDTGEA